MIDEQEATITPRRFFLLLIVYLLSHLVIRALVSQNADLDEAEQVLWSQHLALGYGAELPLYTWLQAIFFSLLGTNIIAVSFLRALLLFVVYAFTYLNALQITQNRTCAVVAAASLMLVPLVSWEAQRILITTLLATALTAVSLFLFLRMLRTGSLRDYLLFGLAAGLGMLTKYNFGIFLLALGVSALSVREFRCRLTDRKALLATAVFLLIVAAPFSWILSHSDAAMGKIGRLNPDAGVGLLRGYIAGFGDLVRAVIGFSALLVPVFLAAFIGAPVVADTSPRKKILTDMIGRIVLVAILLCVLLVLFFHVTHFKSRWFLPLLYPVPIWLAASVQEKLGFRESRKLLLCSGVAACLILIVLPGRIVFARYTGTFSRMNAPYEQLSEELRKAGFTTGVIAAESDLLGGNLKLRFPDSRVALAGPGELPVAATTAVLVVWDATSGEGMPEHMASLVPAGAVEAHYAEAPADYVPERRARLGFVLIPPRPDTGFDGLDKVRTK